MFLNKYLLKKIYFCISFVFFFLNIIYNKNINNQVKNIINKKLYKIYL